MKVLFIKDVPGKWKSEEIQEVKTGYARNYLIPNGIAVQLTQANKNYLENQKKALAKKREKITAQAKEIRKMLKDASFTINVKAGPDDKLFGAVTPEDISSTITKQLSVEINKHQIQIDEPIKKLGIYKVPVRLTEEVTGEAKIWVVSEK